MSPRKLLRVLQKLSRQAIKRIVTYVLRNLLLWNRRPAAATAGFVLPTTILLLLMVALTAGALTLRASSRAEQAIVERQQKVITNAASPAIDRAKAKIEYLFSEDERITAGLPSSAYLNSMMLNNGDPVRTFPGIDSTDTPYRLPDEVALNINGPKVASGLVPTAGDVDNAWAFNADVNGDGVVDPDNEWIVYSILITDKARNASDDVLVAVSDGDLDVKADNLVTRTYPLETSRSGSGCAAAIAVAEDAAATDPGEGWKVVGIGDAAAQQKNFQVNVYAIDLNDVSRSIDTLEFQQSRQSVSGNKWGAWFRYDMDIDPGEPFNWNGAMHTEGNIFINDDVKAHMISSHNSCLYSEDASEIEIRNDDDYKGQVVAASIKRNTFPEVKAQVHVFTTQTTAPSPIDNQLNFRDTTDSVDVTSDAKPIDISSDPIQLFTQGTHQHINDTTWTEATNYNSIKRFAKGESSIPNVDDAFRADDRWGPSPTYGDPDRDGFEIPAGTTVGSDINTADPSLRRLIDEEEGLDGYWERQAIATGLRMIVGQRLELGNAGGWNYIPTSSTTYGDGPDPLYPIQEVTPIVAATDSRPSATDVTVGENELWQRKSLRDNLAAVQGMVVYHYETDDGKFPLACIALTAHPGTQQTIIDSRTFDLYSSGKLKADFFKGKGTNGWEFGFSGLTAATTALPADLNQALKNLAYFAGDPDGGAPSFTPVQDSFIHPFPQMAMWGDFSPLRRVLDSGTAYGSLSQADQATIHSAACTLELLAYNIESLKEEYDDVVATTGTDGLADIGAALTANPPSSPVTATGDDWLKALKGSAVSDTIKERAEILAHYRQIERDRNLGFLTGKTLDYLNPGATIPAYASTSTFELTCDPDSEFTSVTDLNDRVSLGLAFCSARSRPKYPSLFYVFPKFDHNQKGVPTPSPGFTTEQPTAEEYIDKVTGTGTGKYGKNETFEIVDTSAIAAVPRGVVGGAITYAGWNLPTQAVADALDAPDELDQAFTIQSENAAGTGYDGRTVALLDKGLYDGRELLNVRVLDVNLELLSTTKNGSGDYWIADDAEKSGRGIVYAFREDAVREDEIVRPAGTTWANCDELSELSQSTDCFMKMPTTTLAGQDPPLRDPNLVSAKPVDFYADPERRPHGFRLRNGIDISDDKSREFGLTFVTDNSVYIQGDFNVHSNNGTTGSSNLLEEFTEKLLDGTVGFGRPFYDDRLIADRNIANFAKIKVDHWRPVEILADAVTILSNNFRDGSVDHFFTRPSPDVGQDDRGEYDSVMGSSGFSPSDLYATSYINSNRFYFIQGDQALFAPDKWYHEIEGNVESPIWISRDGKFALDVSGTFDPDFDGEGTGVNNAYGKSYLIHFDHARLFRLRQNNQILPEPTYVNALILSGIVPMRAGQGNGGLPNFPRFLEYWNAEGGDASKKKALYFYGSLFQLNFSRAATAPFDQDVWEPSATAPSDARELNIYYGAPNRNWGYDVAQLYLPPGPIASRFIDSPEPRSEFYRELSADDPYVLNLRCAKDSSGTVFLDDKRTDAGPDICPR